MRKKFLNMKKHEFITKNEVIDLLGVSISNALRSIRKLTSKNLLKQEGKARSTKYVIAE